MNCADRAISLQGSSSRTDAIAELPRLAEANDVRKSTTKLPTRSRSRPQSRHRRLRQRRTATDWVEGANQSRVGHQDHPFELRHVAHQGADPEWRRFPERCHSPFPAPAPTLTLAARCRPAFSLRPAGVSDEPAPQFRDRRAIHVRYPWRTARIVAEPFVSGFCDFRLRERRPVTKCSRGRRPDRAHGGPLPSRRVA